MFFMNFYDALSNSKPNPHKPEQELNIHKGFVREAVVVARAYHDMVHKGYLTGFQGATERLRAIDVSYARHGAA